MSEIIAMQRGNAPAGIGEVIGFQPPLDPTEQQIVERAVGEFLSEPIPRNFLGVTALTEVTPDEGQSFSMLRAFPMQLHDSRAEHVGDQQVTGLFNHIAVALAASGKNLDFTSNKHPQARLTAEHTLFKGRMNVWYAGTKEEIMPTPAKVVA
jgi:hypothetical protein